MAHVKISKIIITVLTISSAFICAFETNRTERSWTGVTNAHAWHYGLQRNLNTGYPGASGWYLDYGAIPFAVNVPARTYVPPVQWPDYTGEHPYPSADRPPPTAAAPPPAPASEPSSGTPLSYLPPQAPATTTEFTLPEVIDAKKPTMVTIANSGTRESKRTIDNSNGNGWNAAADFYRGGHSNEPAKIIEMKCDNGGEGRFRAILQWPQLGRPSGVPVLEDRRDHQRATGECAVVEDGARMELEVPSSRYPVCGVTDCSDDGGVNFLCVRLRFPTMAGLRLADDFLLTLRCRIQEPIVIHTKRVEVPVSGGGVAGRSGAGGGAVATGGASNEVRCRLDVLRRSSGDQFSSLLPPGAAVPLGEELLVRITVAEGDGWVSSRLGEVVVQETGVGARAGVSVTLVTADGCAAPEASAVCPQHPRRESALAHALIIRAPMFEGSSSGSSVQLSVRVLACRRAHDCTSDCARRARSAHYTRNGANATLVIYTSDGTYKISEQEYKLYKQHIESTTDNKLSTATNENLAHHESIDLEYKRNRRPELAEKLNSLNANRRKDTIKARKRRQKEAKEVQEDNKMVANSVASVAFAVVRHTTHSNRADSLIKGKGINDKPVAMIIVLGGLVSMLMLAVLLAHIYRKRAQKKEVPW